MIEIQEKAINVSEIIDSVRSDEAGAVSVFLGTIRSKSKEKKVEHLEYDSYDSMVVAEISKIFEIAQKKWPIIKVSIVHRKGTLKIGEIAVVIAVSTPHRKDSFDACQYIIDTLKKTVPIWKKEVFDDGEEWIMPNP